MTVSERILFWNLKRGRPGAFDTIYNEYAPRVYRFCLRLTSRPDDAEDLAQEVFVAALAGFESFQQRCSISTWLYRIALFRWQANQRKFSKGDPALPLNDDIDCLSCVKSHSSETLDRLDLQIALRALPEPHRNAFLLVKAEGLTCREAGDVLELPEGTVRYHIHCAVQALRKSVDLSEIAQRHSASHSETTPTVDSSSKPEPTSITIETRS